MPPRFDYHALYVGVSRTRSLGDVRITDLKPVLEPRHEAPAWRAIITALHPSPLMSAFFNYLRSDPAQQRNPHGSPAPSPRRVVATYSGSSRRSTGAKGAVRDTPACKWRCKKVFGKAADLRQHELRFTLRSQALPAEELPPPARALFEEPAAPAKLLVARWDGVEVLPWLETSQIDILM